MKTAKTLSLKPFVLCIQYRIVGNFDTFQSNHQNLTFQIFMSTQCLVKGSDHPSKYSPSNIQKSVSVKISHHSVSYTETASIETELACRLTFSKFSIVAQKQ